MDTRLRRPRGERKGTCSKCAAPLDSANSRYCKKCKAEYMKSKRASQNRVTVTSDEEKAMRMLLSYLGDLIENCPADSKSHVDMDFTSTNGWALYKKMVKE